MGGSSKDFLLPVGLRYITALKQSVSEIALYFTWGSFGEPFRKKLQTLSW
jgi:hypothetical protein